MFTYRAQRYLVEPTKNHDGSITKAIIRIENEILEYTTEDENYIKVWLSEHFGLILRLNSEGVYLNAEDNFDELVDKFAEHGINLKTSGGESHA